MKKSSFFAMSVFGYLALGVVFPRFQTSAQAAPFSQRDVVYGTAGGQNLLLDVYGADAQKPKPAVIFVHGGAWAAGSKDDFGGAANILSQQGYVCFSVGYRLLQRDGNGFKNQYPAQIDDVQRAVRWIRAHAKTYGVIPNKIGALGASAGGHLVALLGTMDTRNNSDKSLARYSSRVNCVVDFYGPTDFLAFIDTKTKTATTGGATEEQINIVNAFLGPYPANAAKYREASPIKHISKKTVPFLIIQGDKDTLVPPDQSTRFYNALKKAKRSAKLVMVPGAGHGFFNEGVPNSLAFLKSQLLDKK